MEELDNSCRRESHSPEVIHLITHRVGVEDHPLGILHPSIGNKNPYSGNRSTDNSEPGGSQVETFADLTPAEEHHSNEGRLHEEGKDTFDSQWRTEDISDKPAVVRPVCSELEFKDNSGCDTDGKVDSEELLPELSGLLPELISTTIVLRLSQGHNDAQPEGQRNEEPVIHGRQSKLRPRPRD